MTRRVRTVSAAQARLALHRAGLLEAVEQLVAQGPEEWRLEWEYRTVIERDAPLVHRWAAMLRLKSSEVDALFALAATF